MFYKDERRKRILDYIAKLEGISYADWEDVKIQVDNTIKLSVGRHKAKSVLTIHENALKMLDNGLIDIADLADDYSRLSMLHNNNK